MKSLLHRVAWAAITISAAAVVFRTVRVCSHTEGGCEILREQFVAGLPPPLSGANHSDSQIWFKADHRLLEEADRIAASPNSTADDCMGIAWLLSGSVLTLRNSSPDPAIVGLMMWCRSPREPTWDERHKSYEALTANARKLVGRATNLEPDRIDWWRLRALLMNWPLDRGEFDTEGLNAGLLHDPDNAIYDYLLATEKMNRAFGERDSDQGPVRYIADAELFAEGKQFYERGAAKHLLACGEGGFPVVARFLRAIDAPLTFKLACANPVAFEMATEQLIGRIESPLEGNSNDLSASEINSLTGWLAKYSNWEQQIVIVPETLWLKDSHATSIGTGRSKISWGNLTGHIEHILRDENKRDQLLKLCSILGVAAGATAWMFLSLGALGWVICRILSRGQQSEPDGSSVWWASLVLAGVFTITFSIFGLVPAYRPELREYHWAVGCAAAGLTSAMFGWCAWRLGRFVWRQGKLLPQNRVPMHHLARWSLVVASSLLFLIGFFSLIDFRFREVALNFAGKFPSNIVSERGVDYAAEEALGIPHWRSPALGLLEWGARGGMFWTVGLTFGLLLFLNWRYLPPTADRHARFIHSLRYASNSALRLALLLMLICLAVTTQAIADLQTRYQRELARLGDHAWLAKEADAQTKLLELSLPLQTKP